MEVIGKNNIRRTWGSRWVDFPKMPVTTYYLIIENTCVLHNVHYPTTMYISPKCLQSIWYKYDKIHRCDGPAVIEGTVQKWYMYNVKIAVVDTKYSKRWDSRSLLSLQKTINVYLV